MHSVSLYLVYTPSYHILKAQPSTPNQANKSLAKDKSVRFGLSVGFVLSLFHLRRLLRRHPSSKNAQSKYSDITINLLKYFMKFPIFTFLLSLSFKNAFKNQNESHLLLTKTLISSFLVHILFPIFDNEIGILLLVRSLHSFSKYVIPLDLQPESIYVYPIIHVFAYCSVTIWSIYSSNKMWNLFEKCISENRLTWESWSCHNHIAMMASCNKQIHRKTKYQDSCLKSAIYDISSTFLQSYPYFLQIHLITKIMFNFKNISYKLLKNVLIESGMTSIYFLGGSLGMTRIPCFIKWIHLKLFKKTKYDVIGWNNRMFGLIIGGLIGGLSLSFSYKQKQTAHSVMGLWWVTINCLRVFFKLKGDENEKYHWLLGSKYYTSFLFSISMTIIMFMLSKHPKLLRSLERNIFNQYLIQQ